MRGTIFSLLLLFFVGSSLAAVMIDGLDRNEASRPSEIGQYGGHTRRLMDNDGYSRTGMYRSSQADSKSPKDVEDFFYNSKERHHEHSRWFMDNDGFSRTGNNRRSQAKSTPQVHAQSHTENDGHDHPRPRIPLPNDNHFLKFELVTRKPNQTVPYMMNSVDATARKDEGRHHPKEKNARNPPNKSVDLAHAPHERRDFSFF